MVKINSEIRKKIRQLAKMFKKHRVVFAYLFGSRSTGKAVKESDFDVAIALPEKMDSGKRFTLRCKIMPEIARILKNEKIDVVVLNDINSILFKFAIIKEGIVIYEADHGARVLFELKIVNDYYDFSRFIEKYNEAYLKRELAGVSRK